MVMFTNTEPEILIMMMLMLLTNAEPLRLVLYQVTINISNNDDFKTLMLAQGKCIYCINSFLLFFMFDVNRLFPIKLNINFVETLLNFRTCA